MHFGISVFRKGSKPATWLGVDVQSNICVQFLTDANLVFIYVAGIFLIVFFFQKIYSVFRVHVNIFSKASVLLSVVTTGG